MKAGIYCGIKEIKLEEIEKPTIGSKDVIIKVARAGICGTDVHAYLHGGDPVGIHSGNQFGHEFVGSVNEVGNDVKDIEVGMRVTINPTSRIPLGKGLNSTEIADMSGAFSEYVIVEEAKLGYNIFSIPDSLSYDDAVLIEPLSVSTHGVNIANLKGNEKALVYGAGPIGLATVAALQGKGIKDIIISDINEFRLNLAEKLGATTFNSSKGNLIEFIKEKYGVLKGNSDEDMINIDVVFDCAGMSSVISEFMDNAKTLSKLVIVAVHGKNVEFSPYWLLAKEVSILGSRGYTPKDIQDSIDTLADPNCKLNNMITQVFPHSEFVNAFEQATKSNESIKVVLKYND